MQRCPPSNYVHRVDSLKTPDTKNISCLSPPDPDYLAVRFCPGSRWAQPHLFLVRNCFMHIRLFLCNKYLLTYLLTYLVKCNRNRTSSRSSRTDSTSITSLSTLAGPIQRVTTFKLLGLYLDAIVYPGRPTSIPLYPKPSSRVRFPSLALLHHSRSILPTGINPKTSNTYHLQ